MMTRTIETCKQLCYARGYHSIQVEYSSNPSIICVTPGMKSVKICIVCNPSKLNMDTFKSYYAHFISEGIDIGILVYGEDYTSSVSKTLRTLDIHIELFSRKELQYNILEHSLVPLHTKIDHWSENTKKYPILLSKDPVARFMGFKKGDVIRIDRNDHSVYYRFVQ